MTYNATGVHPIDAVQWVDRELLQANSWNPNRVAPPEMALLKQSILEDGWASAIVVQEVFAGDPPTFDHYEVVDGFHRWTVSGDPAIWSLSNGQVPVCVVAVDPAHARISTVRFNRARGSHAVAKMSDIIIDLLENYDLPDEEVMRQLGMDHEEVLRLRERGRMVARKANAELSEAWRPKPVPSQTAT
jgi:ParB-like chromosome segregation protein Spo0J